MIRGGTAGSRTLTGLNFERETDLRTSLLTNENIVIKEHEVYEGTTLVGYILQKHDFYKKFLKTNQIDYREKISKKLLPDEAYFCLLKNTLIIIEKKYQEVAGSVDEKLQTCDFKKKQYEKLCESLNGVKVEYVYVLNDWFKDKAYKDVLEYVKEVGCKYYFDQLPYELFGIKMYPKI